MIGNFRGFIDGERWELILDETYAVSSYGRLMRTGKGKASCQGKIVSQTITHKGYPAAGTSILCVEKKRTIHSLVAVAFIGDRPNGFDINHKNGIKTDNRVENLEYITKSENSKHAYRMGLLKIPSTKLSDDQVQEIISAWSLGVESQKSIGNRYGISQSAVSNIVTGKRRTVPMPVQPTKEIAK